MSVVPPLSVTIITLDEAGHIGAAIDSVSWADEVVVVDAGSRDETVRLAQARGARVESRTWSGWSDQKNFAAALATHDWILSIDADERVTPELGSEIRALMHGDPPLRGYRMPRVTFHLGRWIRTTDFYPDYQTRLYDRRVARWRNRPVHESVAVDGPVGRLTHELQHYSFRDLADQIARIDRYTTIAARDLHEHGRRARTVDLLLHPSAAFLRNYVLRRGVLDGIPGLTISLVNAWGVWLKYAKLWELERRSAPRPAPGIATDNTPTDRTSHS